MDKLSNQNPQRKTVFGLEKKREQVIEMLNKALTDNDLDVNTYEQRIEIANQAQFIEELEEAVYDFPNIHFIFPKDSQSVVSPLPTVSNHESKSMIATVKDSDFVNLFSKKSINMPDIKASNFAVTSAFGETVIDLRDMARYSTEVNIQTYNLLGRTKVKVPANAIVRRSFNNILGEAIERIEGDSIIKQIFNTSTQVQTSTNQSPIYVNILGMNFLGEIIVEYEKSE